MDTPITQALHWRARQQFSALTIKLRSAALDALVVAMAAALVLAAIGWASAALWLALAPEIGAAGAALSVSAALLLPGGSFFWVRRSITCRHAAQAPNLEETAPDFAGLAMQTFGANKLALLMAALVAGAATAETQRGK